MNADVQSLLNHHEPSSHHRAVSCHQPLRRQPAADARCFFPAPVVRDDDGEREVVMMRVFGTRSEAHMLVHVEGVKNRDARLIGLDSRRPCQLIFVSE